MRKKVVAFGEVVWDILPHEKILGGTPSNMVFRCNSFGEEGHLLSRVGDDELGHQAINRLEELGISVRNVQIDSEFPTGTVNVTFDESQEPVFNVTPDVAFDHIEFSPEALTLARSADCLFYGLLPQRFGISKNTIRELIKESPSSVKFLDLKLFQHFFNVAVVEYLLHSANIVRIKEKEIGFLTDKLNLNPGSFEKFGAQLVEKYNIDVVLITRGPNGVFAFHKEQGAFYDAGYLVEKKDNIGSGMAFSAGFLHLYLKGSKIQDALNFGNAAGAFSTTLVGATSYFSKKDVKKFMKKAKKR
ncbi:fructokinase [Mariniphaga anaerophila]|uniref:Fructokinase n=1 Tax=Mariniphaga anaerophila TaxID=1484053 RepID=A0A1M5FWB4_9BACT|nr:PfkB family carbohydrate kinase [Mariniphaga anaerophila]SHF95788.1 fructokinase [Mariniphaga anaerophila]